MTGSRAVGAFLLVVSIGIAVAVAVLFVPGDIEATCPAGGGAGYTSVFGRCINTNESLYLGSLSRAGGLMLGGAMAMLWRPVAIMRGPLRRRARRLDLIAVLGAAGLGVLMWCLSLSEPGREFGIRYNSALFRGGFLLTGLATVTVIAAVTHQRTWAHRVMALAPLRWIGTRSYGLYLFHWPIFQVLRRDLPPELPVGRFAIGVALDLPGRRGQLPVRRNARAPGTPRRVAAR
ncbi:MAG: acyltransferase family protein [Ilumatobacteraceae bacterium]